jgi:hypothetical protein
MGARRTAKARAGESARVDGPSGRLLLSELKLRPPERRKSKSAGLKPAATKSCVRRRLPPKKNAAQAAGHSRGGPWGNWRPAGCALVKRGAPRYWVWDLGEMLRARSFPLSAF